MPWKNMTPLILAIIMMVFLVALFLVGLPIVECPENKPICSANGLVCVDTIDTKLIRVNVIAIWIVAALNMFLVIAMVIATMNKKKERIR